ncbi:liprin-beta-2 [Hetaerina americana]|uniref:liprin-beta-2 n=1 Tax=Hetaerina americana TaxID=62018 RepID=UPI003A7F2EDA
MPEEGGGGTRRLSRTLPRYGVAAGVGSRAPGAAPPDRRPTAIDAGWTTDLRAAASSSPPFPESGRPPESLSEDSDCSSASDSDPSGGEGVPPLAGEDDDEDLVCEEEGGGEGGAEGARPRLAQQPVHPLETISEGDEGCCSSSLALSGEGIIGNSPNFLGTSDYSSSGTEDDEEEDSTLKLSPGGTASHRLNSYTASSSPSPSSTSVNSEDEEDVVPRSHVAGQVLLLGSPQNCTGVGGFTSRAGGAVRLPRLKSMVTNEDLTTTECEEDFQWVRGSSPSYARAMGIEEEEPSIPPPNHPPPDLPLPPPLPARETKCPSGKESRSPHSCKCDGSDDEVLFRRRSSRGSNTDSSSALLESPARSRDSQPEDDMESSYRSTTPRSKHESSPYGGSLDRAKSRRPPPKLRPPLPPSHPPPPLRQRPSPSRNRKKEEDRDSSSCRCSPASIHSLEGYRRLVEESREDDDDEEEDEEDEDGYDPYERRPLSMGDYESSPQRQTHSPLSHYSCPRSRRSRSRSYQRSIASPRPPQCANAVAHRHPMCTSPCCHYVDQEHEDMQLSVPTPYDLYRWKFLLKGGSLVSEFEERVLRLEGEKESLRLQVSVLSEQIEAQAEKICDLEKALGESRRRAAHTEDLLQREMLTRSSLETQKLELLSAASDVRLHHAALERENLQLRDQIAALGGAGRPQMQRRPNGGGLGVIVNGDEEEDGVEQGSRGMRPGGRMRPSVRDEGPMVTSTPMAAAPPVVENGISGASGMDAFGHGGHQGPYSGSPSPSPISSTLSGGSPRRIGYIGNSLDDGHETRDPPPPAPRTPPASYRRKVDQAQFGGTLPRQQTTLPLGSSETTTLTATDSLRQTVPRKGVAFGRGLPHSASSYSSSQIPHQINAHPYYSMSSVSIASFASTPSYHTYHSPITTLQQIQAEHANSTAYSARVLRRSGANTTGAAAPVVTPTSRPAGIRSCSAPNLAETEKVIEDCQPNGYAHLDDAVEGTQEKGVAQGENGNDLSPQPSPSLQGGKPKGIKKIFGKLKRSGSGNLEDLPEGDFRRGGVRSTAGPRLGWTKDSPQLKLEPEAPIGSWGVDEVCAWLESLGLGAYVAEAKRWGASGLKLLDSQPSDLEKEMGIKNPLHRKKLQLAVMARRGPDCPGWDPGLGAADIAERGGGASVSVGGVGAALGTGWVLRWLDDVGLPQHKEVFGASCIDARLLHRLTVEEATTLLHITSTLHLASIRRGIQVLRDFNFDPTCLIRRSVPADDIIRGDGVEGEAATTPPMINPSEVALWTNHRVMEWLRAVDLAEYAPNLRGSGVHGALMVYEPRFTADLLATLLSIPPSKTLLRRHLSTHFKDLVGRSVIGEKREAEATPGYVPLTATAKVKVTKKSQFSLKRKKSRTDFDLEDLICPLVSTGRSSPDHNPSGDKAGNGDSVDHEAVQGVEDVSQENRNSLGLLCNDNLAHLERTSNV